MKMIFVLAILYFTRVYAVDSRVTPMDKAYGPPDLHARRNSSYVAARSRTPIIIDGCNDRSSTLGAAGKNICADTTGRNIAVQYGGTTLDTTNFQSNKCAYSTNQGATWTRFGPISVSRPYFRRLYGGCDARPDYWTDNEIIYTCWHEGYRRAGGTNVDSSPAACCRDDGTFPTGMWNRARMPHTGDPEHNIWMTCIAVAPDNRSIIYETGGDYDFGAGGLKDLFLWESTNAGWNWSQPRLVIPGSATIGRHDGMHIRSGTGGYLFAYFQRDTVVGGETLCWPYYIESTDFGNTWIPTAGRALITTIPYPQYSLSWYNYDCEVVNNIPYVVLTPGVPGNHRNRVEFWKASGTPGNRTWTMILLGGTNPPGTDTIMRDVSITSGKAFLRFADVIIVTSLASNAVGVDPRLWVSSNLGTDWSYRGNPVNNSLIEASLEVAHTPGRGTNPDTDIRLHMICNDAGDYPVCGYVYYEGCNVPILGIEEELNKNLNAFNLRVEPNPFSQRTSINYYLPKPDQVKVRVYNSLGVQIATLCDGDQLSGTRMLVWQGTDDKGKSLPGGAYFVQFRSSSEERCEKVVLLR